MAWNEPGGGRDPWGGRENQQGPPDLEEALKNLQNKLSRMFGGGKAGGGGGGGGGGLGSMGVVLIIVILVAVWGFFGLYKIEAAERGVVTRFGQYVRMVDPGLHWLPPLIEDVEKVNVQQVRTEEIGFRSTGRSEGSVPREALMLTQDENIVDVKFAVQYRVSDAKDYLFNIVDPRMTLRQATESAVREIVGKSKLDFVITEGRSAVAADAQEMIQQILDQYGAGIQLTSVNMQDAQPPAEVQEAFSDAVKAREDEVRLRNEAEAYANDIIPKARGDAGAMREQAEGYRQRVIAAAEGETSRFLSVLTEYEKAPEITRRRLYLETLESVLGNTTKILVDAQSSNNLLFLPLDQLVSRQAQEAGAGDSNTPSDSASASSTTEDRVRGLRESFRGRSR